MKQRKYLLLGLLSVILIGTVVFAGDIEMKINGATDAVTIDKADGSEAMRITADGNVGIGTTTPQAKLDISPVNTSSIQEGIRLKDLGGGSSEGLWIQFAQAAMDDMAKIGARSYDNVRGSLNFYTKSTNDLNSVERLRITPNGNVGIGTTTPKAALDVNSTMSKVTEGTYIIYLKPNSNSTTSIARIENYNTYTMAIAKAEYTQIYAWAGSGIGTGEIIASTRRSNSNTTWTDLNNKQILSVQSSTTAPILYWENGILKVDTSINNVGVYTIQVTIQHGDLIKI